MATFRNYLNEMGADAAVSAVPPSPEEVPIDLADDELEVSFEVNEFLDELGEVFPDAYASEGYGPGEVRVKLTTQRPQSVVALFAELGFHGINESLFQRGTLNVNVHCNDATNEWTIGIQDLAQ